MTLPTAEELNPNGDLDLDARSACKIFLGKSLDEAEALFRESPTYLEDLMWMGPVAFRFYVSALIRYIQSEAATDDSDIVSGFIGLLEFRLEYEAAELDPVAEELALICDYIGQHYERFDVTPEIYGDLRPRAQTLKQALLRKQDGQGAG